MKKQNKQKTLHGITNKEEEKKWIIQNSLRRYCTSLKETEWNNILNFQRFRPRQDEVPFW